MPDDERIFPIVAEAVQHALKRHAEKAGVKRIRVHSLRHSHVAYLINQGVQPLIIKERLGHRDIKITLNTYAEQNFLYEETALCSFIRSSTFLIIIPPISVIEV